VSNSKNNLVTYLQSKYNITAINFTVNIDSAFKDINAWILKGHDK